MTIAKANQSLDIKRRSCVIDVKINGYFEALLILTFCLHGFYVHIVLSYLMFRCMYIMSLF